jgi:hypothetical protein
MIFIEYCLSNPSQLELTLSYFVEDNHGGSVVEQTNTKFYFFCYFHCYHTIFLYKNILKFNNLFLKYLQRPKISFCTCAIAQPWCPIHDANLFRILKFWCFLYLPKNVCVKNVFSNFCTKAYMV